MLNKNNFIIGACTAVVIVALVIAGLFADTKDIQNGGKTITFLHANNTLEHWAGLSWKQEEKLDTAGMLFTFRRQEEREFWMRGMQFDLDVIWIQNGKIVKIDSGVKAPQDGEVPERMSSAPFKIDAVIEVPAGKAAELGLKRGITLKDLVD